jgi:hypothetical protein
MNGDKERIRFRDSTETFRSSASSRTSRAEETRVETGGAGDRG